MRSPSRRVQFVSLLLFAMLVLPVLAFAGPHIRWDQCYGEAGALANKNFACNTNTGSERLTVSCWSPDTMAYVTGYEFLVQIASASASLPAWWQYKNTGTCRAVALTFNTTRDPVWAGCPIVAPSEFGNIAAYRTGEGGYSTTARLIGAAGVAPDAPFDIDPADGEVFLFNLMISHTKTVGTGACAGCTIPVCLAIERMKYVGPNARFKSYSGSKNHDGEWFVSWQGGAGVVSGTGEGCPAAVPVRNATWGAIKTLYR